MENDNLSAADVLARLQPLFQAALDEPSLVITAESSALNTPNWDSLAHIEIIQLVEAHFGVRFALGELHEMENVGDMIQLIREKREAA